MTFLPIGIRPQPTARLPADILNAATGPGVFRVARVLATSSLFGTALTPGGRPFLYQEGIHAASGACLQLGPEKRSFEPVMASSVIPNWTFFGLNPSNDPINTASILWVASSNGGITPSSTLDLDKLHLHSGLALWNAELSNKRTVGSNSQRSARPGQCFGL